MLAGPPAHHERSWSWRPVLIPSFRSDARKGSCGMMHNLRRNHEEEIRERHRYVILLHLYTLGEESVERGLPMDRVVRDLGFRQQEAEALVAALVRSGYVEYWTTTPGVKLTDRGIEYIERLAGRRRSLRLLR
jgi:hypothetical protein